MTGRRRSSRCERHINGHTNGVAHPDKKEFEVVYAKEARIKTRGCIDARVKIQDNSDYCRMCWRKQKDDVKWEVKRMMCKQTYLGCPQCDEPICKKIWDEGYDMHNSK